MEKFRLPIIRINCRSEIRNAVFFIKLKNLRENDNFGKWTSQLRRIPSLFEN